MSWYGFACSFTDLKWPRVAATTRRTHAEALTAVTTAMIAICAGIIDTEMAGKVLVTRITRGIATSVVTAV
jgi:hypothetical protein